MIAKNLEINGKIEYISDLSDFFRILMVNRIIDLYTMDILKDELELVSSPDPNEKIDELKEKVSDLEWENESLEDKVVELKEKISKIYEISSEEYTL